MHCAANHGSVGTEPANAMCQELRLEHHCIAQQDQVACFSAKGGQCEHGRTVIQVTHEVLQGAGRVCDKMLFPHARNSLSAKKMHACWVPCYPQATVSNQAHVCLAAVHMHKAGRPCGAVRSTLAAAHRRTPARGLAPHTNACCCAVGRSLKRSQVLILLPGAAARHANRPTHACRAPA
jgi:hypothetical protein